jgi:hypothetical protein
MKIHFIQDEGHSLLMTFFDLRYFSGHWATYRRYIKAGMMDPESYNVNIDAMTQLEKLLSPAESKVIDGNMLKTCLDQEFNKNGFYVSKNSNFCEEFLYCIRTLMAEVEVDFNSQGFIM